MVLTVADVPRAAIAALLGRFGLDLCVQPNGEPITGSYWGDCEAGVVGTRVYVRNDTPLHSLLHEACHVICMSGDRRASLDTDAGGDDLEEAAVCYLQVLLADNIEGCGRDRLMADMDAWGYSFRLGDTRSWFENDAEDACKWLIDNELLDERGTPRYRLRA
jgi:hypothetical protein